MPPRKKNMYGNATLIFLLLVTVLSYLTYFHNFMNPQAFFWDENYYVTDAQREMNGTFYMQIHPPLGKMIIAAGEALFSFNDSNDQFIGTEHANEFPAGFSITGYRLFPVLLAFLAGPMMFLIFFLLTRNNIISFFLSFLYVFDNALVVHSRGAMLDGIALSFFIAATFTFVLVANYHKKKNIFIWLSVASGMMAGCSVLTKYQGAIVLVFLPAALWLMYPDTKKMLTHAGVYIGSFLLAFVGIWQLHFSLVHEINPVLRDQGYYDASDTYKDILSEGKNTSLLSFPVMLRDTLKYVPHYNKGIPQLNLCKPDENGSPWYFWPFGIKSISYRWNTPDGEHFQYLYLVTNPVVWAIGLLGILLTLAYFVGTYLFGMMRSKDHNMILLLSGVYVSYMIAITWVDDRVLFLYTYFPPLIISFLLFALLFMYVKQIGTWTLTENRRIASMLVLGTFVFVSFVFFSPLTYYKYLSDKQFARRDILNLWDMKCANCARKKVLCFPT